MIKRIALAISAVLAIPAALIFTGGVPANASGTLLGAMCLTNSTNPWYCTTDPGLNNEVGVVSSGDSNGPTGTSLCFTLEGTVNSSTGAPFNSSGYAGTYGGMSYGTLSINCGSDCYRFSGYGPSGSYAVKDLGCESTYDGWWVLLGKSGNQWVVNVGATNDYGDPPYGAAAWDDSSGLLELVNTAGGSPGNDKWDIFNPS
jgi:hypothetical protein